MPFTGGSTLFAEHTHPASLTLPHTHPGLATPSATFPTQPRPGELFYETDTDILWVYRSGGWTMLAGNTPACRVRHSVNQGLADDTPAFLGFNSELADWSVTPMHDTAAGNWTRITMPAVGWYSVGATADVAIGADYIYVTMRLYLNGSTYIDVHSHHPETGGYTVNNHISTSTEWYFNNGDYVQVEMSQRNVAGTSRDVIASTSYSPQFWAVWLRP
jgi:hypothetical protein